MRFPIKMLIAAILLLPVAFAAESRIFKIQLNYDGSSVLSSTLNIVEGYPDQEYTHFGEIYTAKVINQGKVLHSMNFSMNSMVFDGDMHNQTKFTIRIPYNEEAERIEFYHGNEMIYYINVEAFVSLQKINFKEKKNTLFILAITISALIVAIPILKKAYSAIKNDKNWLC
ncbi:hypothetical protein HYU11_06625 [Candidatus Woesearchaeota archaeon]|nr:hypothetical protein [Candidatus Woesearchaeota archaeon]